jgi:flavin reductase (DIM6/NTAB) family NADH-FMN oxidoreductase RutF
VTVSAADFIDAMRLLPAGVTIVTAAEQGRRSGFTATAVCSVAAEPPHLLVCASREMETAKAIIASGHFAVNLLGPEDTALADRFGGRTGVEGEDRFFGRRWTVLASGAPVLLDAVAVFDCAVAEQLSVATHHVIVGRVIAVQSAVRGPALVYVDRDYARLDTDRRSAADPAEPR